MESAGLSGSLSLGPYAAVFAPLDAERRASAVARRLRDSITLGLLPDGAALPPEADLGERLGVATVTVREALAALREEGHVRTKRGRGGGSFVCAPADGGRAALLARIRETGLGALRDLADHYAAIASACARLAAERADEGDLARLRQVAARRDDGTGAIARLEGQFHLDVAASAQSARLTREEMAVQGEFGPVIWLAHSLVGCARTARERHTEIVSAIAAAEADLAARAARAHVGELFTAVRDLSMEARRRP
ncbi:MAG: FadR family transcriptional regulator [Tetrasphaera sp.]|nr:FadR family transcriptional regulator [Tetrasphaera sp.]